MGRGSLARKRHKIVLGKRNQQALEFENWTNGSRLIRVIVRNLKIAS